ncbi:hypothetical protein [Parafrankia elaeagni]|uniref:hypothetical protein n=1 Tax=Parafrankia elaeagni TaxID=222534 RepID=UPI0003722B2D|nr:hypothetical protein [Parafrankia elaeagni]
MTNPLTRIPARRSTLLLSVALAGVFALYVFVRPESLPASRASNAAIVDTVVEQATKKLNEQQELRATPTADPSGRGTPATSPASTGLVTPTPDPTPTVSADPSLTPPGGTATPDPASPGSPSDPDASPTDAPGLLWLGTPTPTPPVSTSGSPPRAP